MGKRGAKINLKEQGRRIQREKTEHQQFLDETKQGSRDTNTGGTTTPTLPSPVSPPIAHRGAKHCLRATTAPKAG